MRRQEKRLKSRLRFLYCSQESAASTLGYFPVAAFAAKNYGREKAKACSHRRKPVVLSDINKAANAATREKTKVEAALSLLQPRKRSLDFRLFSCRRIRG